MSRPRENVVTFGWLLCGAILLLLPSTSWAVDFPGPDSFGYRGSEITFNLRDISTTGTDVDFDDDNNGTAVVPIGFSFSYYGVDYTDVWPAPQKLIHVL